MLVSNEVSQLGTWLQEGHLAAVAGKSAPACDRWLPCWEAFLQRFPSAPLSVEEAHSLCPELAEPLADWLRDVDEELAEAALRSAAHRARRLQFCQEVLERIVLGEDRLNFLCSRAASLWDLKQRDAAEAAFREAALEYPHEAGAFVRWGDCWAFDRPPDFDRAEAIYLQGLEPREQCDLRTISHRLEMLERLKERARDEAARAGQDLAQKGLIKRLPFRG